MQLSNTPTKMVLPFAATGGKRAIPTASQVGITPGAASLADGFPPLTRTALSAGGVPPSGVDMNGVLFEISDVIRWANVGGGYAYDGTFAADSNVGGYPKGARVMRSDGLGYWINTTENNTTDPEATGATAAGWFPDFTSGATAVTMTSSNVTLTSLQYGKPLIVITGALTANLNLIFPAMAFDWTIVNATTGAFSITAKTASGTGTILVPDSQIVVGDGTNIKPSSQFIQLGIGAVSRRFLDKARDFVSVKDFGAVGDGVTNDAAAIQAAVNSLSALTYGGILYFPAGLYLVGATINVPKTANIKVTLYGYGANIARFGSFTGSLLLRGSDKCNLSHAPVYFGDNVHRSVLDADSRQFG